MKTTLLFLSLAIVTLSYGQNVYIPDANFKAYLVGNPSINTNGDTEIQVSEANVFNGTINCNSNNISDLTGIEAFTALTRLYCYSNQLISLDLSQNTLLEILDCSYNQLTTLDLSQNTLLEQLNFNYNQLTTLDLSQNPHLWDVFCWNNQLQSINTFGADTLFSLKCQNNQLTSLDVSQNIHLYRLYCDNNQLTNINLSQSIRNIHLNSNYMMNLDVSNLPNLERLWVDSNDLHCLNVATGTNNPGLWSFSSIGNPNLYCIEADDAAWSTANWTDIDPQTSFSENCNNDCSNTSSLTELTTSKNLIQILDMMGRETSFKPNTPLIYVYDDGSTEKVFSVEY